LDERKPGWQSFHFSTFNADKAFTSIKSDLNGFTVDDTGYPVVVTTPSGEEFNCSPYYYD
jgi:hypothetical protein